MIKKVLRYLYNADVQLLLFIIGLISIIEEFI